MYATVSVRTEKEAKHFVDSFVFTWCSNGCSTLSNYNFLFYLHEVSKLTPFQRYKPQGNKVYEKVAFRVTRWKGCNSSDIQVRYKESRILPPSCLGDEACENSGEKIVLLNATWWRNEKSIRPDVWKTVWVWLLQRNKSQIILKSHCPTWSR